MAWIWWVFTSGISGAMAISFDAYLSHALKPRLSLVQLEKLELGVKYQIIHTLALIAVAFTATQFDNHALHAAGFCFLIGLFCFSGGLYAVNLGGLIQFSRIIPFGGVALILGWLLLSVSVLIK